MSLFDDITIIIVCYKSHSLIKKNLNIIKKFKTILVDNSNCEDTQLLVKNHKSIIYIKTSKNFGYGKANNIGVNRSNTKYVLILNPDILIDEISINNLYKKAINYENFGILAPSLYDENNLRRTNGSRSILKRKIFTNFSTGSNFSTGDTCYDFIIGCAFLIKRQFFIDIGSFDENFFMYFEDNDLCDRVYYNNFTVIEVPSSKMIHMQGESSNINLFVKLKLSLIHKISECIYLKKNLTKFAFITNISTQFFDYLQRFIFNLLIFKIKKSLKNLLRIISILLFFTSLYKFIY